MTTLGIAAAIILGLYAIYKYWFFPPEVNIYYLVRLFNAEYRSIAIVGDESDSSALEPVIRPFESVVPFKFRFQKLTTRTEALLKGWPITFEFPNDPKVIAEREELIPGWLALELHAIGVEFVTKNSIDISLAVECAYQPLDSDGAVRMKKTVKNWSAFADTQIQNILSAWGRSKESDENVLGVTIYQILAGVARDVLGDKDPDADPEETVLEYLNEKFKPHGFKIVSMTLYNIVNGPQSQDVKNKREMIKKAELDLSQAKFEQEAAYERGRAQIRLEKESLANHAEYVERVNKSKNETVLAATSNLSKLEVLVLGEGGFDHGSFTGANVGSRPKSRNKNKKEVTDEISE